MLERFSMVRDEIELKIRGWRVPSRS